MPFSNRDLYVEKVSDVCDEIDELVKDYFRTTEASQDVPPIEFNWEFYKKLDEAGLLRLFTARGPHDRLLGFVLYHVTPHMHHRTTINAACDMLAVRPEARGHGIGRALVEFAEPHLKEAGAQYVTHQFRTCYRTKPLFPKLGYKLIEYGYLKELV